MTQLRLAAMKTLGLLSLFSLAPRDENGKKRHGHRPERTRIERKKAKKEAWRRNWKKGDVRKPGWPE